MNWKMGLLRVWIVLSAVWIVYVGLVEGPSAWHEFQAARACPPPVSWESGKSLSDCDVGLIREPGKIILDAAVYAGSFPLGSFILAGLVAWIWSGFRRR
jgi:hypothetical protein